MVFLTLNLLAVLFAVAVRYCSGQMVSNAMPTGVVGTEQSCYCLQDVLEEDIYNAVNVVFHRKPEEDQDHVMVMEQRGVITEYSLDRREEVETLLDITDRVVISDTYGESRGLLSAVADPHFDTNGRVFVYYIREVGGEDYAYISMFQATGGVLDPQSERALLRVHQPFVHGNGGPMFFGSDGYLYIVTGDGGGQDDKNGYAQSKGTFYGKVLRLDLSGSQDFSDGHSSVAKMYSVPKDNPFVKDASALPEVWALGFRNMWGCSQDNKPGGSGKIFCAETGTSQFDEINVIEEGKNYGWNIKEGNACHNADPCGPIENEGVPIHNFKHNNSHALVGGYVYRGHMFPWMKGQGFYTFGDVISGQTFILKEEANKAWTDHKWPICSDLDLCDSRARARPLTHLLAFGQDTSGELYLVMTRDLVATTRTAKLLKMVPHQTDSGSRAAPTQITVTLIGLVLFVYHSKLF